MIKANELKVNIGTYTLGPITLDIPKLSHTFLVGESASGKSLLFQTIAGFYKISSGTLFLNNICVNNIPPQKRYCAWIPQIPSLFPHINVEKNIQYGLDLERIPFHIKKEKTKYISSLLGIEKILYRDIKSLSGGEKNRVALARVLVKGYKILLLDEPFSFLDINSRKELWKILENLISEFSLTIFQITHHIEDILPFEKPILYMKNGKIT